MLTIAPKGMGLLIENTKYYHSSDSYNLYEVD